MIIYTLGHSNRPLPEFTDLLRAHAVTLLVDVRSIPRSRHNPQFNADTLPVSLGGMAIGWMHMKELGGLRKPRKDSVNTGWHNDSFRGYADYMQTSEFELALQRLIAISVLQPTAIMCAEAVPWRCHRSLIADALTVRDIEVRHIMGPDKWQPHRLTPFAQLEGITITYPFALEG
ncbi:MAG TPA: DUF488 domain-containing protein [Gammaproteobacteria bacterium]|jgi:uncharacterized protein (DUF488 family)|nr:DUF488 domain-containing protein [Gammaproteobacteria bacterium]